MRCVRTVLTLALLSIFLIAAGVPEAFAWSLNVSPGSRTVAPGGTTSFSISVTGSIATNPNVQLLVSPPVAGISASFTTNNVPAPFTSTMIVTVGASKAPGTYTLEVWAHPANALFPGPDNEYVNVNIIVGGAFDFSLSLSPPSLTVTQGQSASYQIVIGYSDPSYSGTTITIQGVSGLAPGMNYQIIPSPPTLQVLTSSSTPVGTYTITLTGSANGVVHYASASLTVKAAMTHYSIDWALSNPSVSPTSPKIGDQVTFSVVLTQVSSDWPGALSVGVSVQLDGNSYDMVWIYQSQPGPIPSGVSKTASAKPWTATAGTHTVDWSLQFFGGDQTVILEDPAPNNNKASLQFTVAAQAPDFRIDATPSSLSVNQGQIASYAVNVAGLNGFNSQVSLTITGLPSGVGSSFSVSSSTPDYSSTLTLNVPGNSQTGVFTLTITGTGGGVTRTTNVVLNVNPAQAQSQSETTHTTSAAPSGLFEILQQNSLLVIAGLAVLVILLAALAIRGRGQRKPGVTQPQPPRPSRTYCGQCGAENTASNEYCAKCGNRLKTG